MQYAASVPFSGDTGKAFGLAESALTGVGFRITQRSAGSVELVGPSMNSTRQSALVGASRIHLLGGGGELAVEADLGGVARMSRFVTLFPLALCLSLAIVFVVLFSALQMPGPWIIAVATAMGGNALLWLLIGPWMARAIRGRTCRGLDALLANMVVVGESA